MQYLPSAPGEVERNSHARALNAAVFGSQLLSCYHQHSACAWHRAFFHSVFFLMPPNKSFSARLALLSLLLFHMAPCFRSPLSLFLPHSATLSLTWYSKYTTNHAQAVECCLELNLPRPNTSVIFASSFSIMVFPIILPPPVSLNKIYLKYIKEHYTIFKDSLNFKLSSLTYCKVQLSFSNRFGGKICFIILNKNVEINNKHLIFVKC